LKGISPGPSHESAAPSRETIKTLRKKIAVSIFIHGHRTLAYSDFGIMASCEDSEVHILESDGHEMVILGIGWACHIFKKKSKVRFLNQPKVFVMLSSGDAEDENIRFHMDFAHVSYSVSAT
jgi:hypothetical protein